MPQRGKGAQPASRCRIVSKEHNLHQDATSRQGNAICIKMPHRDKGTQPAS